MRIKWKRLFATTLTTTAIFSSVGTAHADDVTGTLTIRNAKSLTVGSLDKFIKRLPTRQARRPVRVRSI